MHQFQSPPNASLSASACSASGKKAPKSGVGGAGSPTSQAASTKRVYKHDGLMQMALSYLPRKELIGLQLSGKRWYETLVPKVMDGDESKMNVGRLRPTN